MGKDFKVAQVLDALKKPIFVNPEVTQIAAISWVHPQTGDREVRIPEP